jgi:hypothetical protein
MTAKRSILFLMLLSLIATPATTLARPKADVSNDWATVKAIPLETRLQVRTKDGKKQEGRLTGVSDTALTLTLKTGAADIDRSNIAKVYRLTAKNVGKKTGKSAAIGAGVGFGVGLGLGLWMGAYEDIETAGAVGILGGIGALIGAGAGALDGLIKSAWPNKTLVYEFK